MPLLQPSCCHLHGRQSGDDCDNKPVDNSDEHNDIHDGNCYWHDNCIDRSEQCDDNDHDVRNCDWHDNCNHNCDVDQHGKCICLQPNYNCSPLGHRHSIFKHCT